MRKPSQKSQVGADVSQKSQGPAGEPSQKSQDSLVGTLATFQRKGELVKPAELIEVRGGEKITLLARRIYNQLLANAFGPDMAKEGQVFRIPFSELRGNHNDYKHVTAALSILRRTEVTVRLSNGDEQSVQLLGPTVIEGKTSVGIAHTLVYELHWRLLPILRDSQIFARLDMQLMHGFTSKYGMALYEMVARRIGLKHMVYEDFAVEDLRDFLGVPPDRLSSYSDLRRKALEPAVEEVNTLARFSCRIDPQETHGRRVTRLRLSWWLKSVEEMKAQWEAQYGSQADLFEAEPALDVVI